MSGVIRTWMVFALGFCSIAARADLFTPFLVNGTEANPSDWSMVVAISSDRPSKCTGVVIGPRVIITSAACNKAGGSAQFTAGGKTYTAKMTLSDLWPKQEHDLALGITDQDITGVTPATIGGSVSTGLAVTNLGYGCTDADGQVFDSKLRMGPAAVTDTKDLYVVTGNGGSVSSSSYVCYYDNGGPAFVGQSHASSPTLLAVNSFGDRKTKNYAIRLDIQQSKDFLNKFISANGNAEICGINGTQQHCSGGGPAPGAPTCNLVAQPPTVLVGGNVTIALSTQNVTGITWDGQPFTPNASGGGSKVITTSQVGQGHSHADVTGAGGNASCDVTYQVTPTTPDPGLVPTCKITAQPQSVTGGDPVTLTLTVATGTADFASIDGTEVARPVGSITVKTQQKGDFSVVGLVRNSIGSQNCYGWYHVDDNGGNPNIPNYAVIPSYCGDNTANSDVRQVCIGLVKKDATIANLRINQALYVTYKDNTQEAMPILAHVTAGAGHGQDGTVQETLEMFPGGTIAAGDYQALDMREATLVSQARKSVRDATVPMSVVGYTATGQGFNVPSLNALGLARRK